MKLYQKLAELAFRMDSRIFREYLDDLVKNTLPSGCGFDAGCSINLDENATANRKLVINTSFHHMNNVGFYDGWTSHKVIVTPCLIHGFTLKVTGPDKNKIKNYISDIFYECLEQDEVELAA